MQTEKEVREIDLQRHYIQLVREKVEQKKKELGRPLKMFSQAFGCPIITTGMMKETPEYRAFCSS